MLQLFTDPDQHVLAVATRDHVTVWVFQSFTEPSQHVLAVATNDHVTVWVFQSVTEPSQHVLQQGHRLHPEDDGATR